MIPGLTLEVSAGSVSRAGALEVDAGVALPIAYSSIRKVLAALRAVVPAALAPLQGKRPSEWNRLFPGDVKGAPDLSDLALSPSERRLHRESEQTFWVVNFAARCLLDATAALGRPLLIRNAGQADLVSLRCLMRAAEWSRLENRGGTIILADWTAERPLGAESFALRRRAYMGTLAQRMRVPSVADGFARKERAIGSDEIVDGEGRYLALTVDTSASPERRIAAAVLAVRSAFFSTNYEAAFLATEVAHQLLDASKGTVNEAAIKAAWDELDDTRLVSPAIEIDGESLGDFATLKTLFYRCQGVLQVFTGGHDEALASFQRGIDVSLTPEGKGHCHMFRALMLIKRLGSLGEARKEVDAGLEWLAKAGKERALHEGWLRNVSALVHYSHKDLEAAVREEKIAIRCVGELHSPSATHLKINLISNLSVVQETAKNFDEAIATWRKFEKISEKWGANFHKHHRYRLGGLMLGAGRTADALESYEASYASAQELGDALHRQFISAELGRQALDTGKPDRANDWFERAEAHARELGDPLRLAEALAGKALARGNADFTPAIVAVGASSSCFKETGALQKALATKEAATVQQALPSPRTKLNRPFDQVNL